MQDVHTLNFILKKISNFRYLARIGGGTLLAILESWSGSVRKWIDLKFLVFCVPVLLTACGEGTRVSSRLDALVDREDPYAPFIDLKGGNQVQSEVLENFRDPGFTAGSLFDGDLTPRVIVNSKVNSNVLGQYTVTYLVEDSKGREASAIRRVVVSDSRAPQIILSGANPLIIERSQAFLDPGYRVEDAFDAAPIFSTASNVNTDLVGSYLVDYFANDASGNQTHITREVRIRDTIIPVVTISQPLASLGFFSAVTVRGSCEVHAQTSSVRINGDILNSPLETPCQSGGTYELAVQLTAGEGNKVIRASQTDGGGNVGEDLKVVRRGKSLAILTPASGTSTAGNISLTGQCVSGGGVSLISFSSTDGGIVPRAAVLCDGDAFAANIQLTPGTGSRNITVSQTDAGGVLMQDSRDFNIDSDVPNVAITSPVMGAAFHGSFTLQGTCESQSGSQPVIISGPINSSPLSVSCNGGQFSRSISFTGTPDTTLKSIHISQEDALGNSGTDDRAFQHGLGVAITAPAIDTPSNASAPMNISGNCSTAPSVSTQVRFSGNIQSSTAGTCIPNGAGSRFGTFTGQVTLSGGSQGLRSVSALQFDAANVDGASSPRQFQFDNQAPFVSMTSPSEGLRTRLTSQTIVGACETSTSGSFPANALEVTGDVLGQPLAVNCTSGAYSQAVELTGGDGPKAIRIRQRDFAGNYSTQIVRNINLDTTPPNLAFTAPAEGAFFQASVTVGGSCDWNDGGQVTLEVLRNGTVVGSPLSTFCIQGGAANNTFSFNVNLTGVDGERTLRVRRSDVASPTPNERIITRNIIKDTTPPEIQLNPEIPSGGFHALDICADNLGLVGTATDNLDPAPQVHSPDFLLYYYIRGDRTIPFTATDAAGNSSVRDVLVKVRREEAGFDFDRGIVDRDGLTRVSSNLAFKYIICRDIDLVAAPLESIGGNNNNQGLSGVFYGANHPTEARPVKILNFQNTNQSNAYMEGLFDRIEPTGVVQHLLLDGFTVRGQSALGALTGLNYGSIKQVAVTNANISRVGSSSSRDSFGGLVGTNFGQIEESLVEHSSIVGLENVGGLVGSNGSGSGGGGGQGTILNSFVAASVSLAGEDKIGGLVGFLDGASNINRISNSYALATSGGDINDRGLIGLNEVGDTVTSSYFDLARDQGDPIEDYGTPLDAAGFKVRASFVGWDFNNIWTNVEGVSIPRLLWLP